MGKSREPWGNEETFLLDTANSPRSYGLLKGVCQSIHFLTLVERGLMKQRLIQAPHMDFPGKAHRPF